MKKTILLVGHCGPDAWALKSAVESAAPEAEVKQIDDERLLGEAMADAALLLVNRVLDGRFRTPGGIELIRELASTGTPMMLISNFEDAQEEAMAAGARPGFGKTQLYDAATRERLVEAMSA